MQCREGAFTYNGFCVATIGYKIGEKTGHVQRTMGKIPIMVKVLSLSRLFCFLLLYFWTLKGCTGIQSNKCHLENLSPAELVQTKEEATELGGYFIINGLEKIIRLICMPKRNYVPSITTHPFPHDLITSLRYHSRWQCSDLRGSPRDLITLSTAFSFEVCGCKSLRERKSIIQCSAHRLVLNVIEIRPTRTSPSITFPTVLARYVSHSSSRNTSYPLFLF